MPELPDVEGFRRLFAEHAVNRAIRRVDVLDAAVLRTVGAGELRETLCGKRFDRPWRRGKWLVAALSDGKRRPGDNGAVLLHFGMTGSLHWAGDEADRHPHDRVVFVFASGELRYRDMRKLQGLWFARDHGEVERTLAGAGPDALDVSRDVLDERLSGQRRQIKAALVDQSVVAGLGNLLADEILWRARIHPRRPCIQIGHSDVGRLHGTMTTVLRQSIKDGRIPTRKTWLTGRRDEPAGSCPRCGTTLAHGRVAGRGTTWCPHCQPA